MKSIVPPLVCLPSSRVQLLHASSSTGRSTRPSYRSTDLSRMRGEVWTFQGTEVEPLTVQLTAGSVRTRSVPASRSPLRTHRSTRLQKMARVAHELAAALHSTANCRAPQLSDSTPAFEPFAYRGLQSAEDLAEVHSEGRGSPVQKMDSPAVVPSRHSFRIPRLNGFHELSG